MEINVDWFFYGGYHVFILDLIFYIFMADFGTGIEKGSQDPKRRRRIDIRAHNAEGGRSHRKGKIDELIARGKAARAAESARELASQQI
ncbi:MAG TPA: hypothetical protein VI957_03875 [Candidatus Paceibacterota bacterium]